MNTKYLFLFFILIAIIVVLTYVLVKENDCGLSQLEKQTPQKIYDNSDIQDFFQMWPEYAFFEMIEIDYEKQIAYHEFYAYKEGFPVKMIRVLNVVCSDYVEIIDSRQQNMQVDEDGMLITRGYDPDRSLGSTKIIRVEPITVFKN